jgi:hypothetical protein
MPLCYVYANHKKGASMEINLRTQIAHFSERLGELKRIMTLEQCLAYLPEQYKPEIIKVEPGNLAVIKLKEPFESYFLIDRSPTGTTLSHCNLRFNYHQCGPVLEALGYSRPFRLAKHDELTKLEFAMSNPESLQLYCCTGEANRTILTPRLSFVDGGALLTDNHSAVSQEMRNGFLPIILEPVLKSIAKFL